MVSVVNIFVEEIEKIKNEKRVKTIEVLQI